MTNSVRIDSSFNDRVAGPLDRLRSKFDALDKSTKSSVIAGVTAGVTAKATAAAYGFLDRAVSGVVNLLGDATQAARDEERSIAGLDAALQANVRGWSGNRDAIEEVLASRMKLGFADDEQRTSLGRLIAITKDETKALELQGVAMDLARLRGIDLAAASDIVGKVFGGNIGILSRYGIQIEKGSTSTEALAKVQAMAAGQAEAWAQTNDGKLVASQVRVGEVMEKFGAIILPLVADAMSVVADGAERIGQALDFLNGKTASTLEGQAQMAQGWLDLAASVPVFGSAIGTLADANEAATAAVIEAHRKQVESWANLALETYRNSALAADGSMQAVEDARAGWAETTDEFAGELPSSMEDAKDEAVRIANRTPLELADALRDERAEWQKALDLLSSDLESEMSRGAEIAAIKGELAGKKLARGLKSQDPVVRAQAEATRQVLLQRLARLETDALIEGVNAGEGLKDGLDSKGGAVSGAAGRLKRKVSDALGNIPTWAWGRNAAANYAEGLESKQHAVETAASRLAGAVGKYLKVSSPAEAGPLSTNGGPEGWGERVGVQFGEGLARRLPDLTAALGGMPSALAAVPASLAGSVAMPASALSGFGSGGSMTVNVRHTIDAAGAQALRGAGFNEREVARAMSEFDGLLDSLRDVAAMRR